MIQKTTLDMLTKNSVCIQIQKYIIQDDIEYKLGSPNRTSYENSIEGRKQIETEVEEPYKSAIMAVWGNEPTVEKINPNEM